MKRNLKTSKIKIGYGQGSIYQEGPEQWRAELDGVRRRAKSEAEAIEKLAQLQQRRDGRLKLGRGSTMLGEWLDIWVADYCDELKQKTREGYRHAIRTYIQAYPIARVRLENLSADDIVQWLKALKKKKSARDGQAIAPGTIAIAFRRLRTALEAARKLKYITSNPAADVTPPSSASSREPVILEVEQIYNLLDVLAEHRMYTFYATEITTGLRLAELVGLRWQDIDLEARTITIRGQLQWLKIDPQQPPRPQWIASTKTRAGQREIAISHELASTLRNWRKTWSEEKLFHGPAWRGEDYVFINEEGGPINSRTQHRAFKRALALAGLPTEMTFHDLRHCAGSLMLAAGEDIEAVSELLGHSSRAITERIYAHALKSRKRRAGESLGFLLKKRA